MAVLLLVLRMHIVTAGHFYRDIGRYNIRALHRFAQLTQPVKVCTNASANRPLSPKHKAIHESSHRFGQPFCNPSMLVATTVAFTLVLQRMGSSADVHSFPRRSRQEECSSGSA